MRNRWFSVGLIIVVICVLVSMLTSVWGASKKYTDDPKKSFEVSWYFVGDSQPDADAVSAEASKYLKSKLPNTSLKMYHYDWGTWFGRIPAMVAASEPFDIMFCAEWLKYWDWYNQGAVLPLNDLITKYAPKTKKALGEFQLQGASINGVNYAVPVKKELTGFQGMLFNKSLIDKYKFDLKSIRKGEDIEPWLETIRKNEPDVVPFWPNQGGIIGLGWEIEQPANDWNAGMYLDGSSKGKFFSVLEAKDLMTRMKKTYQWAKVGYIPEETDATIMNQKADNGFVFCRVDPLKFGKDGELSNEKVTWVQVNLSQCGYISNIGCGGAMHAISITSKNPVRAMKVLELANSDPNFANIVTFGVEGKHYTKVGQNIVRRIPQSGYAPFVWETCNQTIQYFQESDKLDKWEKMLAWDKAAKPSPLLGFRYNRDPMSTELAALENVHNQYKSALEGGRMDPAEALPEWIKYAKDAGVDSIIKDLQSQYDTWKKNKKK